MKGTQSDREGCTEDTGKNPLAKVLVQEIYTQVYECLEKLGTDMTIKTM